MPLYAVHLAWVDGHAVKAPVGIWAEGGVSYYPAETESHRAGGEIAKTESSQMAWADWVANRVEWGSSYGAHWVAIESDEPMEAILTEMRSEFFAEEHPVKTFLLPTPGDQAEDDSQQPTRESVIYREFEPAKRFVLAQSWWIAAEFVRRHPDFVIHETHHDGGFMYDVLEVSAPPNDRGNSRLMLNRNGTLQVHSDGRDGEFEATVLGTWADVLAAEGAHSVLKTAESLVGAVMSAKAPASSPRALAYRFIATALNLTVNDRHKWDARNNQHYLPYSMFSDSDEAEGYLAAFAAARLDAQTSPQIGLMHEPESHFWAILRDKEPVAIVSIEGRAYRADRAYDLSDEYEIHGRRMTPLVVSILGDVLP